MAVVNICTRTVWTLYIFFQREMAGLSDPRCLLKSPSPHHRDESICEIAMVFEGDANSGAPFALRVGQKVGTTPDVISLIVEGADEENLEAYHDWVRRVMELLDRDPTMDKSRFISELGLVLHLRRYPDTTTTLSLIQSVSALKLVDRIKEAYFILLAMFAFSKKNTLWPVSQNLFCKLV